MVREWARNNLLAMPAAANHAQISVYKAIGYALRRKTEALAEESGA